MTTFLDRSARAILEHHGRDLRNIAVVLPSQRAALHLRHALARAAGSALWSPETLTLPTLAERIGSLRTLPAEELLLHLYRIYPTAVSDAPQRLEELMQWAPTALRDMSEADAHLVGIEGFYRDLDSWDELDWSFNIKPLSPGQKRLVNHWKRTGQLHKALNLHLAALGVGTAGAVERHAAETDPAPPWAAVWCVGLNALNPAEERILTNCRAHVPVHFAWDTDRYYLEDPVQEAGLHLRRAIARFGPGVIPPTDHIRSANCRVEEIIAPGDVAQAWAAASMIRELPAMERARTAVVLADNSLLQPLLEALPADLGPVNVTMGLPVRSLPAGALVRAFLQMHGHALGRKAFPLDELTATLGHPYAARSPQVREVLRAMGRQAANRVPAAVLHEMMSSAGLAEAIPAFTPIGNTQDLPERLTALLAWCGPANAQDPFANEQLYHAALTLRRINQLLGPYLAEMQVHGYMRSVDQLLRHAEVGLFGEPMQGLQIMGMLETRALDLHRIILLGAQEGKLPASAAAASFIPFEVRRAYGLPLQDGADAVQAYVFSRLLHGAEHMALLRTGNENSTGTSRFLLQLEHEAFHGQHVPRRVVSLPVPTRPHPALQLPPSPTLLAARSALLENGLSPSGIGEWLNCPLDFHFRKIDRLEEPAVPEAGISQMDLGIALHNVVETMHTPWLGRVLEADALRQAMERIPDMLQHSLGEQERTRHMDLSTGIPLLQLDMATKALQRFLEQQLAMVEGGGRITPLALELPLASVVPGALEQLGVAMQLKGRADRVDLRNGVVHILDLKSGGVDQKALQLKTLSAEALGRNAKYAVQLLVYAWLYLRMHPEIQEVRAGLQPLRMRGASDGVYLRILEQEGLTRSMMPAVEALLIELGEGILSRNTPIVHDPGSTFCKFCADARPA